MAALDGKQIGVVVTFTILNFVAITAMGLRFHSMAIVRRKLQLHDALCIVSLIMLFGYRIGVHTDFKLQIFFASQFFWAISIACFRLGILEFYVQTFTTRLFRNFAYGAMGVVCLFFIATIAVILRLCVPISWNWEKSIHGSCGSERAAELAAAGFNLALDVIIVLLPFPVIWGLHMSVQKKAAVMATFALSVCISAINLARIIHVLECNLMDYTFCTANKAILTVAEMAVGITVACVPMLGPVIFPERRRRFSKGYCPVTTHKRWHGSDSKASPRNDSDTNIEVAMIPKWQMGHECSVTGGLDGKDRTMQPSPIQVGDGQIAAWRQFEIQAEEDIVQPEIISH
ncbi:integral membrane protein [Penicillium atrosanguineum]|uniref:Integral membrane protein n=1 Tax=Penicillium atrosanguineum TaxID=1132637 RepID=A0A9W9Q7F0_9EURO|nr:integral membrane protein [Penicillium atrosanguineum]